MATLNTRIVIRNDSSVNWLTNKSAVLLKGEIGIEFLADGKVKMKVGDGTVTVPQYNSNYNFKVGTWRWVAWRD